MTDLRMFATGVVAVQGQTFTDLDDFEAQLITWHSQVLTARHAQSGRCPDPRCHLLPHPSHANGHVITGDTWPDRGDRREARIGSGT